MGTGAAAAPKFGRSLLSTLGEEEEEEAPARAPAARLSLAAAARAVGGAGREMVERPSTGVCAVLLCSVPVCAVLVGCRVCGGMHD